MLLKFILCVNLNTIKMQQQQNTIKLETIEAEEEEEAFPSVVYNYYYQNNVLEEKRIKKANKQIYCFD